MWLFPSVSDGYMDFSLQVWPAGLDMTSNSPQIYSCCFNPHPEWRGFFKSHSVCAVRCLMFPSCALPPHSHPSPHFSNLPIAAGISVPLLPFSHLLSPGLETKASSQSSGYLCPAWKQKVSADRIVLFPVFSVSGAHLCIGGYVIVHLANHFLTALSFTRAQSPHYPLPIASS